MANHAVTSQSETDVSKESKRTPIKWTKVTVAVVTGGNKGIGFVIAKELAKHGLTVVLTARDSVKGNAAVEALKNEEGLENLRFHPLEVTNSTSSENLAAWLKDEFGGIDILVNNAGAGGISNEFEPCAMILDTNYFGVKNVTKALLPLLRDSPAGPRIVNVSSMSGPIKALGSAELREKVADVQNLTEEAIDSLAKKFLDDATAGRIESEGWFGDSQTLTSVETYRVSKLLLNAYTRMLARDLHSQTPSATTQQQLVVFVNAATPGVTLTDLARPFIHARGIDLATVNTPEEGADTIVWLALLPREGHPMGRLFRDRADSAF